MLLLTTTAHPTLYQHPDPDGREVHRGLARLIQPRHTSSIEATAEAGIPWAADNDCFQGLDVDKYVRMLDRIAGLPGCMFATVPDVVGDADATEALFDEWAPELERRGLPLGLVAQDGLTIDRVPWGRIAALFIGGTNDFKLGPDAMVLAREAKRRGVWVHWGRVNSRKRFDYIVSTGAADSFDGSKWSRWRKTYLDTGLTWTLERQAFDAAVRFTPKPTEQPMIGGLTMADGRRARWVVGDAPTVAAAIEAAATTTTGGDASGI